MSEAARRSALAALNTARPAIARLDASRHAEDLAADLIEGWTAVETALRSLIGGSALTGQALIREARGRQTISFDQANSLAEFSAARDRLQAVDYRPSEGDVNAARAAFLKLESGLMADDARAATTAAPVAAAEPVVVPAAGVVAATPRGRRPRWMLAALAAVAVLVILLGVWLANGRSFSFGESALDKGVTYYRQGQREAAVSEFNRAVRDDPKDPMPHVYLSRMAREVGNMTLAHQEAQLAVAADPKNAAALREMGSYLLTVQNYELARRFFVHALEIKGDDRIAQGWLGCTLIRLNRLDEGMRWINRAGQGAWTNCAPLAGPIGPGGAPQQLPTP